MVTEGASSLTAETKDGPVLEGVSAISYHLARMKPGLLGNSAFQEAKVDEWISWAQTAWNPAVSRATRCVFQGTKDQKAYQEAVNNAKSLA